ncbi:hypothetical protein [Bdellovibrio sp. HCB2-146]|uniref:hypothetical protein n=1 Tax=Bdellovibrio sp. HCB2-146 TaxID=3394362 RepID=UPI0039BCE9BD
MFSFFLFLLINSALAASLQQTIELTLPSRIPSPIIIYGNPEVGFFKARHVEAGIGNKVLVTLIPPTYKTASSFFLENAGHRKLLLEKKFKAPLHHPAPLSVQVRGHFNTPFFAMGLITNDTQPASFYPAVVNRLGEVVWYDRSHFTITRDYDSSTNISFLPWRNGLFIRGAGMNSFWNWVDWQGKATALTGLQFDGAQMHAHHSMGVSQNEIFSWTVTSVKLPPSEDNIPVFAGLLGWVRGLRTDGRVIVGSRMIGLNPETKVTRSVVSSFDLATPTESPSRSLDETMDRFLDVQNLNDYNALKKVNNPESYIPEKYDTDWTHENAIDVTPEGNLLITIRNLNSVMLLSAEGKKIWAIGSEVFSTHQWTEDQIGLGLPHSARWISQNRIVVFDNAAPTRGMKALPPQSRVLWLHLAKNGKIEIEKELTLPGDKSLTKGSIRPVDKGYLIWHPGPNTAAGQIIETDSKGNITGHMTMQWPWHKKHDEILGLNNVGDPIVESLNTVKPIQLDSHYDKEVY